jgi:hypothetical protein
MLKGVLKDPEFNSSDEIEEAMMTVWDELTSMKCRASSTTG